ncbi:MAG: hypothetical protein RMY34_16355 [Aulosira sp. DedQUE10]|nr:hypothetical protein [Aulosira sp. DedQUE10]
MVADLVSKENKLSNMLKFKQGNLLEEKAEALPLLTQLIVSVSWVKMRALGCGNSGLNWFDVKPLIESVFVQLPDVQVIIFEP